MQLFAALAFTLSLLSSPCMVDGAPIQKNPNPGHNITSAPVRTYNCTAAEQASLHIALEDARYMADLSVRALKLHDNEQESSPGIDVSISTNLTRRWFGEEVLRETKEGLEMRGYVQDVFDRMSQSLTNNTFGIDYHCQDDGGAIAYSVIAIDYDTHKRFQVPVINMNPRAWTRPASLNRTLRDPGRNVTLVGLDSDIPLGAVLVHEQAHILVVGGEKQILDICVPGHGSGIFQGHHGFHAEALAWLDSGLAIHNAHNYAAFAMDLAETVDSGKMPAGRFDDALPAGGETERKQGKIDGMLQFLKSADALKPVMVTTMPLVGPISPHAESIMRLGADSCAAVM